MEIFDFYDRVNYNNVTLTNILRRAKPIKLVLDRIKAYHDYQIKEGERADTIAYDYYGSPTYTWLIYITNNIYDPYYQWPLTHYQLFDFINKKYGDAHQAQIDIHHYTNENYPWTISEYTFNQWGQEQRIGWVPVTNYEYEHEVNERKRNIKLVSNRYLDQINQQIEDMFN